FLDEAWSAERALGAGLVGEVVADERLVEAVGAFAARLASGPTFACAQTKRLLRDGAGRSLAEQWRAEQAAGLLCGRSEDAAEALRAVAEKRSPQFSGR
ncbi:enoyl-CoA hydratase/isomerase family protein, partial [Pseudomonas aeruginosa]|uniref:enoyl-CoA hydratase-related protein n=1 Tax=Pseudomonas aeruginosa TaxID=287 RepID=UPI00209E7335